MRLGERYRPRFEGGYLAFRNAQGDWFVSRAETEEVHRIYSGERSRLVWAPGGRHLAILDTTEGSSRLLVMENRL
jgi:hypothetical protein